MSTTEAHVYRLSRERVPLTASASGMIPAACWCDRRIVLIRRAEVGRTTRSCGARDCREPERN